MEFKTWVEEGFRLFYKVAEATMNVLTNHEECISLHGDTIDNLINRIEDLEKAVEDQDRRMKEV